MRIISIILLSYVLTSCAPRSVAEVRLDMDELDQQLASIEGQYELDDYGRVSYRKVVAVPGVDADELYRRAELWYSYSFRNAESVIDSRDREAGYIVGGGPLYTYESMVIENSTSYAVMRVDLKDNRARLILTIKGYESSAYVPIAMSYPFHRSDSRAYNYYSGKTLYGSHLAAHNLLHSMEYALMYGNTSSTIEARDWK